MSPAAPDDGVKGSDKENSGGFADLETPDCDARV